MERRKIIRGLYARDGAVRRAAMLGDTLGDAHWQIIET
jgi:hypothetical protein